MSSPQNTAHENRLASATSPYLLQHKHNPVDWWQWGPEALAEAKRSNRPILLSVGYAACHWCHVMAHESFEDAATAAVMNELFVNIKVDREERPDIDQIYMNALHLLGEQGGWPLTMFLTPQAEPVWGGTYFPKEQRYGRPAFTDILREVARLFREEPKKIEQNRASLLARLADTAHPSFRNRRFWRCFGGPAHAPAMRAFSRRSSIRWIACVRAAFTITSAAAFRAIRWTSAGWCRISRRCFTTTHSSWSCWRWPISAAARSFSASARARPWNGSPAK